MKKILCARRWILWVFDHFIWNEKGKRKMHRTYIYYIRLFNEPNECVLARILWWFKKPLSYSSILLKHFPISPGPLHVINLLLRVFKPFKIYRYSDNPLENNVKVTRFFLSRKKKRNSSAETFILSCLSLECIRSWYHSKLKRCNDFFRSTW